MLKDLEEHTVIVRYSHMLLNKSQIYYLTSSNGGNICLFWHILSQLQWFLKVVGGEGKLSISVADPCQNPSVTSLWPRIVPPTSKKNLDKSWFLLLCDFFLTFYLLMNDVNVAVFQIRILVRRIRMFLGLPDPHPDPLVRGIRIRGSASASASVPKCHGSATLLPNVQ
jgi:hypothetical protein